MLGLLIILLVLGVTLTVVLWAGTLFLQGYFYTEPTSGIFWQAPAAGLVLTLFFGLWCLLDYNAEGARPDDLPYDTIFRFSAEDAKAKNPVPYLWAIRKNEKAPIKYRWAKSDRLGGSQYQMDRDGRPDRNVPWRPVGVIALLVEEDGQKVRYDLAPAQEGNSYRRFLSPDGWEIKEYDSGPTGQPTVFRTGRFLANMLLNLLHFGVWFACLSLILRFQYTHALGLALVLWLVTTLTVLPMLLIRAGVAAQESALTPRTAASPSRVYGTRGGWTQARSASEGRSLACASGLCPTSPRRV